MALKRLTTCFKFRQRAGERRHPAEGGDAFLLKSSGHLQFKGLCCKVRRHVAEWLDAGGSQAVSDFKGRHFEGEIVLWAVRWYCRGISYRDLEQMMAERGVTVDHSTI